MIDITAIHDYLDADGDPDELRLWIDLWESEQAGKDQGEDE